MNAGVGLNNIRGLRHLAVGIAVGAVLGFMLSSVDLSALSSISLFTPSDPAEMTREQLNAEIDKVRDKIEKAEEEQTRRGFNQTWNQYVDRQADIDNLRQRLRELQSARGVR